MEFINKGVTANLKKSKVIYKFKYHCDNVYIGRTSERFNIRRDQHILKSLRSWMDMGLNKPSNRLSAISEHLLKNYDVQRVIMIVIFQF